ncbi:MAG: alpha-amylase [Kaiparowitsia implicata GSE-PSE-MK54-09C]|jgi:alpha-amylase|nr:alpha-amylase [Kaiparowitsia implicata GSE-PSE-MK54-09C]
MAIPNNVSRRLRQAAADLSTALLPQIRNRVDQVIRDSFDQIVQKRGGAEINGVMMQYFHWYNAPDSSLWNQVRDRAPELAQAGITALWLPPASKASGGKSDVGYGAYDLFDLGEFDQKDTVSTKYGTKAELIAAVHAAHKAGIHIYADIVFNHKNGGDAKEVIRAIPVDAHNRSQDVGAARDIKVWTHFYFPGRGDTYSSMQWHWYHFDGVNHNMFEPGNEAIYRFEGKHFDQNVELKLGNYDFLLGCDLDMEQEQVVGELKYWGEWFMDTVGVDGFRLDAIKHIQGDFFNHWIDHLEAYTQRDLFTVGEYWTESLDALHWYIGYTGGRVSLFDVPLHYNFHRASKQGSGYDLRRILDNTLMQQQPVFAVTFVDNHDSQPLQSLESPVEDWFKPLAYAVILLRREGYPCVFYADYYGAHYKDKGRDGNIYEIWLNSHKDMLNKLLQVRHHYAYGDQYDYFDHPNVIGWTRLGNDAHAKGMAVLLSNGKDGHKWMEVGKPNARFVDATGAIAQPVHTNADGWAEFRCKGGSVSVWVQQ